MKAVRRNYPAHQLPCAREFEIKEETRQKETGVPPSLRNKEELGGRLSSVCRKAPAESPNTEVNVTPVPAPPSLLGSGRSRGPTRRLSLGHRWRREPIGHLGKEVSGSSSPFLEGDRRDARATRGLAWERGVSRCRRELGERLGRTHRRARGH